MQYANDTRRHRQSFAYCGIITRLICISKRVPRRRWRWCSEVLTEWGTNRCVVLLQETNQRSGGVMKRTSCYQSRADYFPLTARTEGTWSFFGLLTSASFFLSGLTRWFGERSRWPITDKGSVIWMVWVFLFVFFFEALVWISSWLFFPRTVSDGLELRPKYRGIWHCMRSIWQQEGLRGLYQGVTPNVWGAGASWGLYFFL